MYLPFLFSQNLMQHPCESDETYKSCSEPHEGSSCFIEVFMAFGLNWYAVLVTSSQLSLFLLCLSGTYNGQYSIITIIV